MFSLSRRAGLYKFIEFQNGTKIVSFCVNVAGFKEKAKNPFFGLHLLKSPDLCLGYAVKDSDLRDSVH